MNKKFYIQPSQPFRNMLFIVDYSRHTCATALWPITSPESKVKIFCAIIPKYATRNVGFYFQSGHTKDYAHFSRQRYGRSEKCALVASWQAAVFSSLIFTFLPFIAR